MPNALFIPSIITFLICACVIIYTKFFSKKTKKNDQNASNPRLNSLLMQLRQTQLYPLSCGTGWLYTSLNSGFRVWQRKFYSATNRMYTVDACFSKVPASAQVVLRYLRDPATLNSWMPDVQDVSTLSVHETLPNELVKSETHQDSMVLRYNWPTQSLVHAVRHVVGGNRRIYRRLWLRENNGCCWMLLYNVANDSWFYFLSQPIEDVARSVLTVLAYDSSFVAKQGDEAAILLRSMCDMLYHRKIMITPLLPGNKVIHYSQLPKSKFTRSPSKSSRHRHESTYAEQPVNQSPSPDNTKQAAMAAHDTNSQSTSDLVNSNVLVNQGCQQVPNKCTTETLAGEHAATTAVKERTSPQDSNRDRRGSCGSWSLMEDSTAEELEQNGVMTNGVASRVKAQSGKVNAKINKPPDVSKHGKFFTDRSKSLNYSIKNAKSVVPKSKSVPVMSAIAKDDTSEDLNNDYGEMSDDESASDSESVSDDDQEAAETVGEDLMSSCQEHVSLGGPDELLTDEQRKAKDLNKLHFWCNQAAAEIQNLVVDANNVDIEERNLNVPRNPQDWIFCSVDQDVVVMKRMFRAKNAQVLSYLGKGIIESAPCLVWDTVRNPRVRFAYDDTLKKVDIVSVIEETLKIVYYYHEVVQLFRKGSCDFTLAQKERQDDDTYILSMHSWPKDATTQGAPKVTVLPSGWFLERVIKDGNVCTMATYITQVEIPLSMKSAMVTMVDELMSKQPLAILLLRDYLKPFTQLCSPRYMGK